MKEKTLMKKKILSLILAVILILGILALTG